MMLLLMIGMVWAWSPVSMSWKGMAFGTYYRVIVVSPRFKTWGYGNHGQHIETVLSRINGIFSTYDSESELSRWNANTQTEPQVVSPELYAFFERSQAMYPLLGGAWDPTVMALSRHMGFQPGEHSGDMPVMGWEKVIVVPPNRVQKTDPRVMVDFSSNAKGYAVDAVYDRIQQTSWVWGAFVDIGGEIRAYGRQKNGDVWRIGVQSPDITDTEPIDRIWLADGCVASSGNYRNTVVHQGKTVGHILDPRTRTGVTHNTVSVSVVASDCFTADTLATGLFVLNFGDARAFLANYPQVSALIITQQDWELMRHDLNGFEAHRLPEIERPKARFRQ
jgi:thiamine biosynthesis lipoprotein